MAAAQVKTHLSSPVIYLLISIIHQSTGADDSGTKCYKDKTLGDAYKDNVYWCNFSKKTECCEVNQEFTCCEPATSHTFTQQIVLWGAVFGVVGTIAFLWICYRKDTYMCEGVPLMARAKSCCRGKDVKDGQKESTYKATGCEGETYSKLDHRPYSNHSTLTTANVNLATRHRDTPAHDPDISDTDSGRGSALSDGLPVSDTMEMVPMGEAAAGQKKGKMAKKSGSLGVRQTRDKQTDEM